LITNIKDTAEEAAVTAIRSLASFTQTGSLAELSKARKAVRELAAAEVNIAIPLCAITIFIQRAYLPEEEGLTHAK
jgi:hypothetical protein